MGFLTRDPIPVEALEEDLRSSPERTVVTLQAIVRHDHDEQGDLERVEYLADDTTEASLTDLAREVSQRWPGASLLLRQRLGPVRPGETSAFIAVVGGESRPALTACHHAMERLRRLPGLLRREVFQDGSSRFSERSRETLLLSDDAIVMPQS